MTALTAAPVSTKLASSGDLIERKQNSRANLIAMLCTRHGGKPGMAAKIIKVEFPRLGKIRCPERDLRFPQLFRISAFEWDMNAERTELFATDRPVAPSYALRVDPDWKVHANPTFTPVDAPDAYIERGYVIVRHHDSEQQARGYQDAVSDFQHMAPEEYDRYAPIYCIGGEFFTVVHRPPVVGAPQPAIVYSTYVFHRELQQPVDWHKAIGVGGKELDVDDLFPEVPNEDGRAT